MTDYKFPGLIGRIERQDPFQTNIVESRIVDVWLPPDYDQTSDRFSVIYMMDGQNLFNPEFSRFSHIDWGMDETITRLISENKIKNTIVVGVWSTKRRGREYVPQKAVQLSKEILETVKLLWWIKGPIYSDHFLQFVVNELKPWVDQQYRTKTDAENTIIMGSSAGALISLYAICEYPGIFGGAGCISTHFPLGKGIMLDYMKVHLPNPENHCIYFDYGTGTLEAEYEPYQNKADEIMREIGYTSGVNWLTKRFEGHEHSEKFWRERVHIPLEFLLKKES